MFPKKMSITPAMAVEWLETKNSRNRPVSQTTVDRYAQEMRLGNWKLNGETLIFGKDGQLMNGQHRLKACIAANKSFDSMVIMGVENDTFDTIDDGSKRSLADVFAIRGETCSGNLAAGVRFLHVYATGQIETRDLRRGTIATKSVLEATFKKHPGMRQSVKFVGMLKQRTGGLLMPTGMAIGLHYLFALVDEKKADEFFSVFQSGVNLTEQSPIFLLRNRLIMAQREKSSRLTDPAMYYYVVVCFNAFQTGLAMKRLVFVPNSSPIEIEGLPKKLMKEFL